MTNATTIAGRYRLEGRLGVGGMATVQLAFDQRLERNVAIKLLAEHLADDPAFVSRFRREALSAARLVHPNIVQVFDFGFDERQHQHFIVMEHVPGQSCAELLREQGHLDTQLALEILVQACRGLDYAHRNGVVHRDVKPGNLLVSDTRVVKLADFGIARATDQSSITQVGSVLGTAAYLAPEQARGEEAGPRADLYSLGVVAYQLLSGRLPYEAGSLSELALKQQRESPPQLDLLNRDVTPELALAVALALSIDQRDRPPDAMALADSLEKGAAGLDPTVPGLQRRPSATMPGPDTAATRVVRRGQGDAPTAATRLAGAGDLDATTRRPVRRLEAELPPARMRQETPPRRVIRDAPPARRRAADPYRRPAPAPPARRGGGSRAMRRLFGLVALLCVIAAAVIVAVTVANGTSHEALHLQHSFGHGFQGALNSLRKLINSNTQK